MTRHDEHLSRFTKFAVLVSLITSAIISDAFAQEPYQRRVRKLETPELGIANPAGLAFSPAANALIVVPSQGNAELSFITFAGELDGAVTVATTIPDPFDMAFDGKSNSLLFFDASVEELVEIKAGPDGRPLSSPGAITRFSARTFGVKDAKGMTYDPATGNLFMLIVPAQSAVPKVVRIVPDPRDRFVGPVVSNIVLDALKGLELRGIAFNPNDGHLYIMSPAEQKLYEVSQTGEVLTTRDLSSFELSHVQNMVFAPSGDQTDDPAVVSLYIDDSGQSASMQKPGAARVSSAPGLGDVTELSLTQPAVQDLSALTVQASLVRTVLTSQWSPPSPDPSGIAYIPSSNSLIISDGEVEEMSIYAGVNYWEVSLTGNQIREYTTFPAFSDEPCGAAYNPNNHHLYFSDDTGTRMVYELNPGPDGRYGTNDDIVTSFKTGDFGSSDPEGITYDTFQGHLFIVDGVNTEVYEISPGANGRFDGVPPSGDDVLVQHFDTGKLGQNDPEGVEFNTDNGNLYIVSNNGSSGSIVETTRTGTAVSVIDISFLNARSPAGLAYAPSSVNPLEKSLYIVDRAVDNDNHPSENDGKMFEISLGSSTPSIPSISINDVTVTEGNSGSVNAVFTVTLSATSSQTVTVNYATANGTATAGSDYVAASGQVSFSSGQTSRSITVAVNGDLLDEPNETFFVNLSNAVNATIGDNQGLGTINDNDPTPSLAINDVAVTEGNSGTVNAVFTVTLSAASGQAVTVNYATANGTATASSDYAATSGSLSFSPGQTSRPVTVVVNGDVLAEPDETFFVNLSNAVNATISDNQGLGTITNDDGVPSLVINDIAVTEGNTGTVNAVFTVTLSAASSQTVTVNYATANGTATAGSDYVAASGQVSFQPGQTSQPITVVVNGDALDEPNETFFVNLSNAVNAFISDAQGAGTINDDDPAPSLAINDVAVAEGNSGPVNAVFAVTLSAASGKTVTVNYATANGTATAGSDYVAASGQVSFSPGQTSQPVTVVVNGDLIDEPNETFVVNLSNAVNATIGDNQGTGTINDDDGAPSLAINDVVVTEGNSGTVNAVFAVTLSATSSQTVTVNYATADGSATAGSDYVSASGQVTFQPGETSRPVTVVVNGDLIDEPNETFFVNLSNAVNAAIGDNQGTGTITNDDGTQPPEPPVTVSFQDGVGGYTGTRDTKLLSGSPTTNYGTAVVLELDGSPDNSSLVSWDLTSIPSGSIIQSVDITVNVTNTSSQNYEIYEMKRPWVEGAATWNQYASGLSWEVAGADGSGDRGTTVLGALSSSTKGLLTISLNAAGVAVVQSWVDNPSSNLGFIILDYINASNGLDFSSREHGIESERPKLTVTYGGSGAPPPQPSLAINDVVVTEGNSGTINAVFAVTLSAASSQTVTVDYATADGTATAGTDYVSGTGQVTFQPGETSRPVTVVVNGDGIEEPNETFYVNLSNAVNATIGDNQGTGTIINDDGGQSSVTVSFQDGVGGYTGAHDTKLLSGSPTTNYGTAVVLEVDGSPDNSSLLSWDLASIPSGSIIQSVDLTVNVTNTSSQDYEIYEMKRPWVEGAATWNVYASGVSWEVAGADGAGDRGTAVLGALTSSSTGLHTFALNASGVALVQSWVDNPASNHGIIVLDYINASNGLDFSSREHGIASERPKLTVTYSGGSQAKLAPPAGPQSEESTASTETLPETIALSPNYPNPFNLETRIEYALPEPGRVSLVIYNVRGQQVRKLVDEIQPGGYKRLIWNGRDDFDQEVGSGIYLIRLVVGRQSLVRKASLLK